MNLKMSKEIKVGNYYVNKNGSVMKIIDIQKKLKTVKMRKISYGTTGVYTYQGKTSFNAVYKNWKMISQNKILDILFGYYLDATWEFEED